MKSKSSVLFYCGLLAHLAMVGCQDHGSVYQSKIAYDLERLYNLKPAFKNPSNNGSEQRYVLVTYFHHLDCQTCVNRELTNLKRLYQEQRNHLDFLIVTFVDQPNFRLEPGANLRSLRRVGMVRYPILVETIQGEADLGSRFCISLIDKNRNTIVLQYFPDSRHSHWPQFEKKLHKILSSGL